MLLHFQLKLEPTNVWNNEFLWNFYSINMHTYLHICGRKFTVWADFIWHIYDVLCFLYLRFTLSSNYSCCILRGKLRATVISIFLPVNLVLIIFQFFLLRLAICRTYEYWNIGNLWQFPPNHKIPLFIQYFSIGIRTNGSEGIRKIMIEMEISTTWWMHSRLKYENISISISPGLLCAVSPGLTDNRWKVFPITTAGDKFMGGGAVVRWSDDWLLLAPTMHSLHLKIRTLSVDKPKYHLSRRNCAIFYFHC